MKGVINSLWSKFTTEERYNFIVDNFTYRNITIAPGTVIQVEDISTFKQRVLVRDVPFEVTNDVLKALMEDYGEVIEIKYMRKKHKNGKYGTVVTGRRILWMTMQHESFYINVYHPFHPPSQIFIKFLSCRLHKD